MKSALLSIGTLVFGVVSLATSTVADAAWYETYDFSSKGVAGYWPLDGNANDVTGNGNDGTVHEAVLTTGKLGQGYDFDGADDRIQINNSLMNGFSAVTMACWMKADSFDTNTSHLIVKAGQDGQFGPCACRVGGGLPSSRTRFVFSVCRLVSRRCHAISSIQGYQRVAGSR